MHKTVIRQDVQVVRGLAIISVVMFHFYPENFPNGYLGVDQFFVISGYLMCMLLKKVENNPWHSLIGYFYYRRMKRILPLYLSTIFFVLIFVYMSLTITQVDANVRSATKSLLFISNDPGSEEAKNYFEKLSLATDYFTHTWSLSVEVQFYAIVPFMFLLTRNLSTDIQLAVFTNFGLISFVFHVFTPRPAVSFNSVFARIWQFMIGMIAYLKIFMKARNEEEQAICLKLTENEMTSNEHKFLKYHSNAILVLTIAITTYSTPINPLVARVLVTVLTALFIYASSENIPILNEALIFTGNISFALYLIHWPLYAPWKMMVIDSQIGLTCTLLFAILISTVVHGTFEKWALKLEWKSMTALIVVLTVLNTLAIWKEEIEIFVKLRNPPNSSYFEVPSTYLNVIYTNLDQVEVQNRLWQKNDFVQLCIPNIGEWVGKNHRPGLPAGGTSKFMIMGSSTLANLAPIIQDECGSKASEIFQVTYPACEPMYPTNFSTCCKKLDEYHQAVRVKKPDYLFMGARFLNMGYPVPDRITNFTYDPILAVARDQLQKYMESVSKKIIIVQVFPRPHIDNIGRLAQLFREKFTPPEIDKLVVEPLNDGYRIARKRYDALLQECGAKCEVIDYTTIFHNKTTKTVRYFNEIGLSYFTMGLHLTPVALEIVRPVVAEICQKL